MTRRLTVRQRDASGGRVGSQGQLGGDKCLKWAGLGRGGLRTGDGSVIKNPPANAGDVASIPGWGRSPGEGNGNPLQYSCLGDPTDRGTWWVTVHGVTQESDMT